MQTSIESTEQFIVSTMDATLAGQNAAIAAESMGLGICFIGSLRNNINRINDLLKLPDYVVPLFGLAIGYPNHKPGKKPRLPLDAIYHENTYDTNTKKQQEIIKDFDQHLGSYYKNRSKNRRVDTWTEQMIRKYSTAIRMDVAQYIKDKKLNIR